MQFFPLITRTFSDQISSFSKLIKINNFLLLLIKQIKLKAAVKCILKNVEAGNRV